MAENKNAWRDFNLGVWCDDINVSNFIKMNYTAYNGDSSFLEGPTERTKKEMEKVHSLLIAENEKGGVLDIDKLLDARVGHRDDARVGLNCAEGEVGGLRTAFAKRVEQG